MVKLDFYIRKQSVLKKIYRLRISLLILIVSLLLTACGDTTPEAPATVASDSDATSSSVDAVVPTAKVVLGSEEFGLSMDELVTRVDAIEALIAECMSNAGFEYIAVDFNTIRRGMVADKSLPGVGERQFHIQYGFGISTLYTGLAPQMSDETTPAKIGLGEENIAIFNSLPETDQVAYNQTLLGEYADATLANTLELEDFSRTGGCTRTAIEQVFSEEEMSATYFNPLDAAIEEDPRMVEAMSKWVECMKEAGFDYPHPLEVEREIRRQLDALTGGQPVASLSADAQAEFTALQEHERSVAIVAFDCEVRILEPVEDRVEDEILRGQ